MENVFSALELGDLFVCAGRPWGAAHPALASLWHRLGEMKLLVSMGGSTERRERWVKKQISRSHITAVVVVGWPKAGRQDPVPASSEGLCPSASACFYKLEHREKPKHLALGYYVMLIYAACIV